MCGSIIGSMRAGDVLGARFELETIAGEGGMGAVWRARDRLDGATVAVKALRDFAVEGGLGPRFAREAALLAELRHPAVVRYLAHGELPSPTEVGSHWLAMEWLEGEDLHARLSRSPLSLGDSLSLARRIADALGAAHARGVIHRDVKPGNVLLVESDPARAKLLDFGIARRTRDELATRLTRTGAALGTPGYMAPEQARGDRDIDARADVFSLGCVLFRCVTGRRAFLGDDVMAVLAKVLLEEAPPVRAFVPEIPEQLDALIGAMLAKDRALRPADGAAVATALAAIQIEPGSMQLVPAVPSASSVGAREQRMVSVVAMRLSRAEGRATQTDATGAIDAHFVTRDTAPSFPIEMLRAATTRYGARVEELADGSILAVLSGRGGATDRAAQAARCALSMHAAMSRAESKTVLSTGRALIAPARAAPLGEAIDRAASLLRLPPCAHVRLDDATAGLLDSRFDFGEAPDGGFALRGEHEAFESARTLLGKPTACVGRDREIATLEAYVDECAAESVTRVVVVTGAPGIGKSRVRYELLHKLASRGEGAPEVWFARGDPIHAGSAFTLIAQALRRLIGVQMGEAQASQQRKILARVARHVPEEDVQHLAETIGELLDAGFPDENSERLRTARADPIAMGDQIRRAVEDFMDFELRAHPLVIVLEDLQWGDLPSVTLLDGALRWLRERPLMVLAFAREEVHEVFPRLWADSVHEIKLGELGKRASERLVRAALGNTIDETTLARIVARAEGNAFYLEEIIRAVDAGRDDALLPATLLAMVAVRLEALPADMRHVLRAGSVFGEVFWRGALDVLLGGTSDAARTPAVTEWLEYLCERELLVRTVGAPRFPGQDEYAFRHALVRETSYAMLTDDDRVFGHRLAGEWLAKVGERDAIAIAEHFEKGLVPARAVTHWLRGAELALEGNDFEAALARAERGLRCGAEEAIRGALRGIQSDAFYWRGETASSATAADEARMLLPDHTAQWADAMSHAAVAYQRLGRIDGLVTIAETYLARLERPNDAILPPAARVSITLRHVGKTALADALLKACERNRSRTRSTALLAAMHTAYGYRALSNGDAATFVEELQAAAIDYVAAGDPRRAAAQRCEVAYGLALLGAYEKAEWALRDNLVEAERSGLRAVVALANNNLGLVLARLGKLDAAREAATAAVAAFREQNSLRLEGGSRIYLADVHLRAGQLENAAREAAAALSILESAPPFRPYAFAILARAFFAMGDVDSALARSQDAMAALEALGGTAEEGEAIVRLTHAECLRASGALDAARDVIVDARRRLLDRASKISSAAARESFLTRVEEHARTVELAREWSGAP